MLGPLGILGGGQLGRMTLQAASTLGIDVVIGERFADSPAARLTSRSVVFAEGWRDAAALEAFAKQAPVVTLENEFVDAAVLHELQQRGCQVWPSPACVATVPSVRLLCANYRRYRTVKVRRLPVSGQTVAPAPNWNLVFFRSP